MKQPEKDDDLEIIRLVLGGRREAFAVLVRRHQSTLLRMAANLAGDPHEAQDIAQQAFVDAYLNLARYDASRGSFRTWLLRLTKTRCLKFLRKKRPATVTTLPDPPARSRPEDRCREAELKTLLDRALAAMPEEMRSAFVLVVVAGLSCAEAAEVEKVPPGTLRSRLSRARQLLRRAMNAYLEPSHES